MPFATPTRLLVAVALTALAACGRPAPADAPAAPAPPASLSVDTRALALAEPVGDDRSAQDVRVAQRAARSAAARPDHWIVLGHAWVRHARAVSDPGVWLHARAAADVVLHTSPDYLPARHLRAMAWLNDHAFVAARDEALAILAQDPQHVLAWGTLADARLELGDFDGAGEAIQTMVDLKPGLPSYVRAAWLRWLGGDEAGATRLLQLAIGAGGAQADREAAAFALTEAANVFWHAGDLPGAAEGYRMALAVKGAFPPALEGLARVHLAQDRPADAADALDQALAARPTVAGAALLAVARARLGQTDAARGARTLAERIGRQTSPRELALYWANRDVHTEEALRLAEAEHRARPGIYTEDVYAWALFRAGRLAEAQAASDRALAHGTPDARLLFHAGAIRMARGARTEGRTLIERALARNPHFDPVGAAEARRLLEERGHEDV